MHAKLLLSTTVDALFLAELRLFEHEVVSDQEVDVVCSPTTACMLLVESDLVRGVKEICQRVEVLTSFANGVVLILNQSKGDTHTLQVELMRLGLKSIVVSSFAQAGELAEYLRRQYGHALESVPQSNTKSMLAAVECIDGVSKNRAAKLQSGSNVKRMATASIDELKEMVGIDAAKKIHLFFASEKQI